jgi:hypothetical protein
LSENIKDTSGLITLSFIYIYICMGVKGKIQQYGDAEVSQAVRQPGRTERKRVMALFP